ncbi:MAG: hypothetical protein QXG39_09670 [Candidatus Aenigmatarchaeota archaeon]
MSELEIFKTKAVCALVLRLNAEDFRSLKEYIVNKFGPESIIYQKMSFDKLYITNKPPKRKEVKEDGGRK